MPRGCVLVVDDDDAIVESTVALLRASGIQAEGTTDPASVLPLMRALRPIAVLHDYAMPGLEWAKHIEAIRADPLVGATRIMLFSAAFTTDEIAVRFRLDGVLSKPCRPTELLLAVAPRHGS